MKNLFAVLLIVFGIITANCQGDFTPLNQTFKKPNIFESIAIKPGDKVNKFYRKKEKYTELTAVYIYKGFTAGELAQLLKELAATDVDHITWEADSLNGVAGIFSGIEKLTVIHPERIAGEIEKLNIPVLELDFGNSTSDWQVINFNNNLEELVIKSNSNGNATLLVEKLQKVTGLTTLSLPVAAIKDIPSGIEKLPSLKLLTVSKTSDYSVAEEDLLTTPFWISVYEGYTAKIITIDYCGSEPLTEAEKKDLLNAFPASSFVGNPGNSKTGNFIAEEAENPFQLPRNIEESNRIFENLSAIKPLIAGAKTQREIYSVNTDKPANIRYANGTTVSIPSDAFVDENGEPVKGPVEISYREIKTPLEMIWSGVPMAYDSAGETHQFQSAGNFEILAAQDGKPLKLAPGKTIEMEFVSTDTASDYNLYQLNPATNNWQFTGTANNRPVRREKTQGDTLSWAIYSLKIIYPFDTTHYEYRFASLRHYYMLDRDTNKGFTAGISDRQLKRSDLQQQFFKIGIKNNKSRLVKVKLLKRDKKDSTKTVRFVLQQKPYGKAIAAYFPELRHFSKTVFYLPEHVTRKEFVKDFIKGKKFNDIKIEYTPGDEFCIIYLKDNKGIYDFEANISNEYYDKRPASVVKRFEKNYLKYKAKYNKRMRYLNNDLALRMKNYEKQVSRMRNLSDQNNVSRALSVSGLGVYNCDQISRLQSPVYTVKKPLIINETDSIEPTIVYVVDKKINGVLTYWDFYGLDKGVSLNKTNTQLVIAMDKENNIYFTNRPADEAIEKNFFKMQKLEKEKITDVSQFAEMVGL